jgi:hypothetical protein
MTVYIELLYMKKIRRRAEDGNHYSAKSVLRAVATRHTPQRLTLVEF